MPISVPLETPRPYCIGTKISFVAIVNFCATILDKSLIKGSLIAMGRILPLGFSNKIDREVFHRWLPSCFPLSMLWKKLSNRSLKG